LYCSYFFSHINKYVWEKFGPGDLQQRLLGNFHIGSLHCKFTFNTNKNKHINNAINYKVATVSNKGWTILMTNIPYVSCNCHLSKPHKYSHSRKNVYRHKKYIYYLIVSCVYQNYVHLHKKNMKLKSSNLCPQNYRFFVYFFIISNWLFLYWMWS
jgi:hypothetical protein